MKSIIVMFAFSLAVSYINAQSLKESEVPQSVKASFTKAYASAKEVKWEKEDGNYEASFDQNKKEMSVVMDANGNLLEVENEITKGELPKAVQDAVAKDYAKYKINEIAKIVANGKTTYEVEVEEGGKSSDVIFEASGKLVNKKEKADEKDKD